MFQFRLIILILLLLVIPFHGREGIGIKIRIRITSRSRKWEPDLNPRTCQWLVKTGSVGCVFRFGGGNDFGVAVFVTDSTCATAT